MKKIFAIIGSIFFITGIIFLSYVKREGDKHAAISAVLNQMGGYEY